MEFLSPGHFLGGAIAFTTTVTPPDLTGDVVDYDSTGLATAGIWRQGADINDRIIRSLAGGIDCRLLIARNVGSSRIILPHEDTAGVAANRFTITGNRNFLWYPSQTLILSYISPRWRIAGTHDLPRISTPASISTTQVDWLAPDASTGFDIFNCGIIRAACSVDTIIRSLGGAYDWRVVDFHNIGTRYFILPHEDTTASVTAALRFNFGGNDQFIAPQESCQLIYDPTVARWRRVGGYRPFRVLARSTSNHPLLNQTAGQRLFNVSPNGAIALPGDSTFKFKCRFDVTGMSTTSGNLAFNLLGAGTAALSSVKYTSYGLDNNNPTNAAALSGLLSNAAGSAAAIALAGTGTGLFANIEGTFSITGTAGTIIPSVALLTAVATATVSAGAYIEIERIGPGTPVPIGIWS